MALVGNGSTSPLGTTGLNPIPTGDRTPGSVSAFNALSGNPSVTAPPNYSVNAPSNNPYTYNNPWNLPSGTIANTGTNNGATNNTGSNGSTSGNSGSTPSTFGSYVQNNNPYLPNPTGNSPNGSVTNYNPSYFATPGTANALAGATGGTVTQGNDLTGAPGSPFTLNQLENMVTLPNGLTVNAGVLANLYSNGYPSSITDASVANALNFGANGQAGNGIFTVQNGQISYNPNGAPTMQTAYGGQPGNVPLQTYAGPGYTVTAQANTPAAAAASLGSYSVPNQQPQQPVGSTPGTTNTANGSSDLSSILAALTNPQVQALYGANPLTVASNIAGSAGGAGGTNALASLLGLLGGGASTNTANTALSSSNNNTNMLSIATLLNALYAMQNSPANGVLSPLFWGNAGTSGGTGAPVSNYYPIFP